MRNRKKNNFNPDMDIDDMEKAISGILREEAESGKLSGKRKPLFFSIGVKMEPNGNIRIDKMGNFPHRPFRKKRRLQDNREPLSEVIETENEITLTLEVPNAKGNDLRVKVSENKVVVSTGSPANFYKEFLFDSKIIPAKASSSFRNGIAEINLQKAGC
jgi:HSP20 family protein